MIAIRYQTPFETIELREGETAKSLSPVGEVYLSSIPDEIKVNDNQVFLSDERTVECSGVVRISIRDGEQWHQYLVQPVYPLMEEKDARTYIDFIGEKARCHDDFADMREIEWVQFGQLHLFDCQSLKITDNSEIFQQLIECLPALRNICKRPKSHLKSVNEIRPIDAVKRIGHEAIPYLAAHNEDWEARTATGLKPARLFSRTEDDDFQIYENRVVKTVIDMALRFLRRLCRDLQQTKDQLNGILMSSGVSTASFGFDLSHQKCVNAMMGRDENSEDDYEEQNNQAKRVTEELRRATQLLRRYRELKQTRLYRLLHKIKPITGSLMPTNILRMDKNYHRVYLIWSPLMAVMHKIDTEPRIGEVGAKITASDLNTAYTSFLLTLSGFAAHSLGFEEEAPNLFIRKSDAAYVRNNIQSNLIQIEVGQEVDYHITVSGQIYSPLEAGTADGCFFFDGQAIHWHQKLTDSEIENFARKLKTRESRGEQQAVEARKYRALRQAMTEENASKQAPHHIILIVPVLTALDDQSQVRFVDEMKSKVAELKEHYHANVASICMPLCRPNEQAVTDYGYSSSGDIAFFPVSMYDINSYRRLRLMLLRFITEMEQDRCPCCGEQMIQDKNGGYVCYHCDNLQVINTICSKCGSSYKYLSYGLSAEIRQKMCHELDKKDATDESRFFRQDSLFQYKNIVPMHVDPDRVSPVCPYCASED